VSGSAERHVFETPTRGSFRARPPAAGAPPAGLLVGFHGYAQTGEAILAELARVPGASRWAAVAPDALHAFYDRRGTEVLRNWMTRDLRLEAIEDNLRFVRGVLDRARARFGWRLPVAMLGFSQGVAMAWRAAVRGGHECAALVALAGDVPPELLELPREHPFPTRVLLATGERDEWYTPERLAADVDALAARGVAAERLVFDGGHEWGDAFRTRLGELLESIVAPPSS
jgi:predicted esterase